MTETKKGIRERSIDTQMLMDRLDKMEVGDVVEYGELTGLIGRDVRPSHSAYGNLQSARHALMMEKQKVFDTVPKVGVKRADDVGIVAGGQNDLDGVRRRARKGLRKLACVKYENLPEAHKRRHDTFATQLGVLHQFSRRSTTKKIGSKVDTTQSKLPLGKTLELFGNGKEAT